MHRRLMAMAVATTFVIAACGGGGGTSQAPSSAGTGATQPPGSAAAGDCLVGVSWNNYTQERWAKADEPNIQAAVTAGGGTYERRDARDNSEQQLTDIDSLIAARAPKVLIVLAKDARRSSPAIEKAKAENIPVIALRPPDRGPEHLLHHVRQQAGRHDHRPEVHEGPARGQLRDHQGRPRRRERRSSCATA